MNNDKEVRSLSNEQAEVIHALPALSGFLPHVFQNGFKLSTLTIVCAGCKKEISAEKISAKVAAYQHSISIEGYGVCYPCKLITPTKMRFGDDGNFLAADCEGNWKKGSFIEENSGWFSRLKALFTI